MRKWILRALYVLPVLMIGGYVLADYTSTQGTVAAFTCQSAKICPGVAIYDITGTTGVAVKAASTAAAVTDPSAVVQDAYLALDFGAPGATACASDTASCNLNQQMQRLAQRLSSMITALGSPFQAGANIGNTSFAVTQATGTNLHMVCDSGCSGSGGTSITDNAAFTTGTTAETPVGCYAGTPSATANHSTVVACTTAGSVHTTVDNSTTALPNNADAVAVQTGAANSPVNNYGYVFNGTTWDRAPGSTTGAQVKVASGGFAAGSFLNATAGDPCMFQAKTNVPISTATGTVALVTGVSAKKVYICSISLIANAAVAVSIAEGSGTTCGTSAQAAILGVATNGTAANGLSLAANGGFTLGNGGGTVAQSATAANYVCLFQSGTVQIAGNITYVQQ